MAQADSEYRVFLPSTARDGSVRRNGSAAGVTPVRLDRKIPSGFVREEISAAVGTDAGSTLQTRKPVATKRRRMFQLEFP